VRTQRAGAAAERPGSSALVLLFCVIDVCIFAHPAAGGTLATAADNSGGTVLPGADVTIENFATHERRVAQACGSDYVIDRFPPDDYSIKISSRGFITANGRPRESQVLLKLLF